MPQPHHLWPDVNIGGTPLSAQTEALLEQVVVDHHQHLPDMFAITFHDPDRDVISQLGVNIGSTVTIKMTPPGATAVTLINKTRVTRGGLPAATVADGVAGLLTKLQYEQDVELPGDNATPYFNRRRIDGLQALTPHQMPIPAKELGVLGLPYYTFGGTYPGFSPAFASAAGSGPTSAGYDVSHLMREAPAIWNDMFNRRMARIKAIR